MYDDCEIKLSHIMRPKTGMYAKSYGGQTMYFLILDDDLSGKYNTIWDKVNADVKKGFDSAPVYNKNFLKRKIKSYGDEATNFCDK